MKRFTETEKWKDSWFRKLSPVAKLLWFYMLDACDHVGVFDLDMDSASFHIGAIVTEEHMVELGERVIPVTGDKYFIPKFIRFQYKNLSTACPAQSRVFDLLTKYASSEDTRFISDAYPIGDAIVKKEGARPPGRPKGKTKVDTSANTTLINGEHAKAEEPKPVVTVKEPHPDDVHAETIYMAYPKKVGKPDALKAIKRALMRCPFELLLARTNKFNENIVAANKDMKYVPNPSTWFNQDRFNDNIEESAGITTKTIECSYGVKNFEQGTITQTTTTVNVRILPNGDVDPSSVPNQPHDLHLAVVERLMSLGLW